MTLKAAEVKAGDSRRQVVAESLTRTQIVQYAGDVAGYPGVFAHGMLTMGMTARVLTDWAGDSRLLSYGVRFTAQVWPGDTLTTTATIREVTEHDGAPVALIDVVTANQDGTPVITGTATARLDP
jgi:acyl dehydratase